MAKRRKQGSAIMNKIRKHEGIKTRLLNLTETFNEGEEFEESLRLEIASHNKILRKLVPSMTRIYAKIPMPKLKGMQQEA